MDAPEQHSQLKLMPQQLRERTFDVLLALVEGLSRRQMVVAVYEDLQWADRSTLEFLDRLIHRIAGLPVLVVMTFRPEFETAWTAAPVPCPLPSLRSSRLLPDNDRASVRPATLAEPVLDEIIERSRGVPLLIEELTSTALEAAEAIDGRAGRGQSACGPPGLAEAVTARLGSVVDSAAVAAAAAVIGREFTCEMLAALADWPEDRLAGRSISWFLGSGRPRRSVRECLLRVQALADPSRGIWQLAEPVRRSLHYAVAQFLEERAPDVAVSTPELMARHYAAAGASERAVAWCLRAGKRAADCCAHAEAIALFSKGLELLDNLPAFPEQAAYRAAVLAALARSLIVTKGAEAPEVDRACGLARVLCQGADPHPALLPAIGTLWDHYSTRADFEAAGELAGHFHQLAAGAEDPAGRPRRISAAG